MEPTIYKPSIYNGAGIYKTGAAGGGGGESWRDWYEELERLGYKISTVQFNNLPLMAKLNINCHIETKHTHILGTSESTPKLLYVSSNQGSDNWTPAIEIDQFTTNPYKIWIEFYQPWSGYQRLDDPFTWFAGQTQEYIGKWNKYGLSLSVNGTGHSVTLGANVSSSWYAKQIRVIHNGSGNSQMYFYYTKVYDENDDLIMNFIPVKRKVDGLLGVLETITGLFASGSNLSEG